MVIRLEERLSSIPFTIKQLTRLQQAALKCARGANIERVVENAIGMDDFSTASTYVPGTIVLLWKGWSSRNFKKFSDAKIIEGLSLGLCIYCNHYIKNIGFSYRDKIMHPFCMRDED